MAEKKLTEKQLAFLIENIRDRSLLAASVGNMRHLEPSEAKQYAEILQSADPTYIHTNRCSSCNDTMADRVWKIFGAQVDAEMNKVTAPKEEKPKGKK